MKAFLCKYWWLVLVFILIPVIVWIITLIPRPYAPIVYYINESHWLSFFGGYLGAGITALVTLYILRITTNQNSKNLRDTLQMSINTANFSDANNEITTIKKVLDDNYRLLDYQRFVKALSYIRIGNYNYAKHLLIEIARDIEMVASSSDIYLKAYKDNKSEAEQQYFAVFERLITDFGVLVNDFNFITSIPDFTAHNQLANEFYDYVEHTYEQVKSLSSISDKVKLTYTSGDNFFRLFLSLQKRESLEDALKDADTVIFQRLQKISEQHKDKIALLSVSQELIKYKEAEAKKILTNKLDS